MVRPLVVPMGVVVLAFGMVACSSSAPGPTGSDTPPAPPTAAAGDVTKLPAPSTVGTSTLEEALAGRRSIRDFTDDPLSAEQISQLLWAAQGITAEWGGRTAPSAGALYPLEVYVVTAAGLAHYLPEGHRLEHVAAGDRRGALAGAALDQEAVADAPAVFVITAVFSRTAAKYGERATRYVHLEAGHACQNLLLQATALGLGGVPIGAFSDNEVRAVLGLPSDHEPLYLVPIGVPAEEPGA